MATVIGAVAANPATAPASTRSTGSPPSVQRALHVRREARGTHLALAEAFHRAGLLGLRLRVLVVADEHHLAIGVQPLHLLDELETLGVEPHRFTVHERKCGPVADRLLQVRL